MRMGARADDGLSDGYLSPHLFIIGANAEEPKRGFSMPGM